MRTQAVLVLSGALLLSAAAQAGPIEVDTTDQGVVAPLADGFGLDPYDATLAPEQGTAPGSGDRSPVLLPGYYIPIPSFPPIDTPEPGATALLLAAAAALGLARRRSS